MKKTIIVIGATGMIGQAVSKQLKNDGFTVRVLSRSADKAREIFKEGFEIVVGDVFKKGSLVSAFDGIQGIYINLPEQNIEKAIGNILQQLKLTAVEHIGYTSGCTVREENASHPMIRSHFEAENKIMESGMAWSIFRPIMVLDTLPAYANKGKPFIIGHQPHAWSWIHTVDMARMISKAFQTNEALNKKFTLFGPDKLSIPEAIDLFNEEFYPSAKKAKPTPYWISHLLALFIGSKLKYAISIFKYFKTHPEEGDPFEANKLLGLPLTGMKEFFELYRENTSV